jgi:hypothetical protein
VLKLFWGLVSVSGLACVLHLAVVHHDPLGLAGVPAFLFTLVRAVR